jgi:hypothetical protein
VIATLLITFRLGSYGLLPASTLAMLAVYVPAPGTVLDTVAWPRPFVLAPTCCVVPSGAVITTVTEAPLTARPLES